MRPATAALALGLLASCGEAPPARSDGGAAPAAGPAAVATQPAAPATRWTHPLPGVVRPDQGTIEITVRPDRPQHEFGNDWDFPIQIVPDRIIGKGANTLLGVFVPPAPDTGLVALIRTGKRTVRVEAKDFAFSAGKPVNLAVSWGAELSLWADGRRLGSAAMGESPDESLWPALMTLGRCSPFDPQGLRISSVARDAASLDADPATPFATDADTTLVAGADFAEARQTASRWHQASGYAAAKPAWLPEEQCLEPGAAAIFPLVVANHGPAARTATLDLTLTPLAGGQPQQVHHTVAIPAGTTARLERIPLPALASDHWQVAWSVAGDGLPALSGTSAIAVYPRSAGPADGPLADFYAVHAPESWDPAPFTRMGVRATRAWAQSTIFLWHRIEPVQGRFRFEEADEYVATCLANRLEPLAVLGYPSRWAAVEPSEEHKKKHELAHRPERWKPADLQAWERYVRALGERYRGRVRHWEVYNEVNFCPPGLPATFSGSTAEYLELQRIAWRVLKQIDPANQVLSSGFSADVNKAMPMDALKGGLADVCDIFNVHGYSGVEGTAEWVGDWRKRRPGAPVWQTEQMWFQIDDDRRRWWLTAALPVQYAADGYRRFYNMGVREVFFHRTSLSPTRDQWVVAVLNDQLRPCAYDGRAEGAGARSLDLHHRFRRSDGTWLTVVGSERGAMRVTLSAAPAAATDLFGRPLRCASEAAGAVLEVPDLAYLVSAQPLAIATAIPLGDAPLFVNGGFEQIDGDVAMGGLAAGKPRGYTLRDKTYDPEGAVRLSAKARTGTYAVELESSGKGRVYLFQNVQIPEAGTYELGGWFRRDRGAAEPYLFLFDQDSGKIHEARLAAGGDGFQELRLTVTLAERNKKPLAIGWGIRGSGSATLDDIAFAAAKPRFDAQRFRALDLGPAATLPRGGWSASLPGLGKDDLGALDGGECVLAGRSWVVGERLVAVGDAARPALPRRAEIAVAGTAKALCFLHTALWVQAKPGDALGRYVVTYDDGSTAEHPLLNQRIIADWYKPAADKAVPVATSVESHDRTGRNLYTDRWANPTPAKTIRSVAVEGAGNAVVVVAAISAEKP